MPIAERGVCTRCILPEDFPGIRFNDRGECSECQKALAIEDQGAHRAVLRQAMDAAIEAARGKGAYDCIVAFSGGKDSSYTLKLLVERYGLRCRAITIDNGFMSDQARANCQTVTGALGVDFEMFRPSPRFMNTVYLESARNPGIHSPSAIKRASSTCSSCITLINTYMIKAAVQNEAPLIAGGYIAGQVPVDASLIYVDPKALAAARVGTMAKFTRAFGVEAERHFLMPRAAPGSGGGRVALLNPMVVEALTDEAIVAGLASVGWRPTTDTGANSTNCRLNDLGILVHFRQYGFSPYLLELAEKVRAGLLDRSVALQKASTIPAVATVADQARQIGLDLGSLP